MAAESTGNRSGVYSIDKRISGDLDISQVSGITKDFARIALSVSKAYAKTSTIPYDTLTKYDNRLESKLTDKGQWQKAPEASDIAMYDTQTKRAAALNEQTIALKEQENQLLLLGASADQIAALFSNIDKTLRIPDKIGEATPGLKRSTRGEEFYAFRGAEDRLKYETELQRLILYLTAPAKLTPGMEAFGKQIPDVLKDRGDITVTGAGTGVNEPDDPKRQYALNKYIESMNEEIELLKERVPYYREYIAIKQMEREDVKPDDKKLALSKDTAASLAEEARKLYDLREAYKYVDEGYRESIAIQEKFSKQPEKALIASLELLKSTVRGDAYTDEEEFIDLLLRLAKSGTSLSDVADSVIKINDAFKSSSKGKVASAIKDASAEKFTGMGLDPSISESTKSMIIQLSNVSDDYLATVLELATGEDKFTTESQKQVQELRKLFDARGLLLAQSKDIQNVNAAMYAEATKNVASSFIDIGPAVGGGVTSMLEGSAGASKLADWKAAEDKLEQYRKSLASGSGEYYDKYADSSQISIMTDEVERLAKAYGIAAKQASILANVTGKIMDVLATSATGAALDSFYELGISFSSGAREMKNLGEVAAEWGKTMLNQLPAIFLQGAMASFQLGAPGIPMGVAFLAAALGTSFLGGLAQSKETQKEDQNKDSQMMSNLQDQMQRMLDQFRQSILYLEVARSKYIADSSLVLSPYALGGTFNGTGLSHGIYQQPTYFNAYAKGDSFNSVMGEAGAEAVLPLRRGPTGQLGVIAGGNAGSGTIVLNITNKSDTQVSSTSVTESDGMTEINLLLEKVIVGTLASGKADSVLRSRYNVSSVGRY